MKNYRLLLGVAGLLLLVVHTSIGQVGPHTVTLKRTKLISTANQVTPEVADHALRIASYILSSQDFQDSVSKRVYDHRNICSGCGPSAASPQRTLAGSQVLQRLLAKPTASLTLTVQPYGKKPKNGKCYGLGSTCPNSDSILSYYQNIMCDMGDDFPFAYAYAVHLCHEYTHNVGYCHTDNSEQRDAAESVGWIAFHFLKQWYDSGTRVP
jgi:hypothetical protein